MLVCGQPFYRRKRPSCDPAVEVTPDWWNRMPYLPLRIFIRVGVLGTARQP
jgi:hypothetical protein